MVSSPPLPCKLLSDAQIRDQTRINWLRSQFSTIFTLSPEPANPPDENFHVSSQCVSNGAQHLLRLMNTPVHTHKKIGTICIEYVQMRRNSSYRSLITGHDKKAGTSLTNFILKLQSNNKLTPYCTIYFPRYPIIGLKWKCILDQFEKSFNCDIECVTREKNPLFLAGEETAYKAMMQCTTSCINYYEQLLNLVKPYEGDEPFCRITIKPVTAAVVYKPLNKLIRLEQKKEKKQKRRGTKHRPELAVTLASPTTTVRTHATTNLTPNTNPNTNQSVYHIHDILIDTKQEVKRKQKKRKKPHKQRSTRSASRRRVSQRQLSSSSTTASAYVTPKQRQRGSTCCACGDVWCNSVSKFFGPPVANRKLCYRRPSQFKSPPVTYSHKNKLKRAQIVHNRMLEWRKECGNKVTLSTSARFNEIHYPRQFLHDVGECTRLPMTIPIPFAKKVGMFRDEYVVYNPRLDLHSVLVVPCVTTTDALTRGIKHLTVSDQVQHECICFTCVNTSPVTASKTGATSTSLLQRSPTQPCLQPYRTSVLEQNVFVWRSKIHNYGLFARKSIAKGDIICLYSGSLHENIATNKSDFICTIQHNNKKYHIDSNDILNYSGRWCNHSVVPNARLLVPRIGILKLRTGQHAILVECVRTIKTCDEIFINYGVEYYTTRNQIDTQYYTFVRSARHLVKATYTKPNLRISWKPVVDDDMIPTRT